jgi:hypothetical protein
MAVARKYLPTVEACARVWADVEGNATLSNDLGVSSTTDDGTGLTDLNFSETQPNTDYSAVVAITPASSTDNYHRYTAYCPTSEKTTTAQRTETGLENNATSSRADEARSFVMHGDAD